MKYIIGAGFSGLIAATQFKKAEVVEANDRGQSHNALLRFKTDKIAKITGIEFRKVKVKKQICYEGKIFNETSIKFCNRYSKKVIGRYQGRSITDISDVERYVAPNDFYNRLIETVGESRIFWNTTFNFGLTDKIISTVPMSVMSSLPFHSNKLIKNVSFGHTKIHVYRAIIKDSDVFQTIYFPGDETPVYRASITGNMLLIEAISEDIEPSVDYVLDKFGMGQDDLDTILPKRAQSFGKIAPIQDSIRRAFVLDLTMNHGIYSLGRFATWRNILLDDLANDIEILKQLEKEDDYFRLIKGNT